MRLRTAVSVKYKILSRHYVHPIRRPTLIKLIKQARNSVNSSEDPTLSHDAPLPGDAHSIQDGGRDKNNNNYNNM